MNRLRGSSESLEQRSGQSRGQDGHLEKLKALKREGKAGLVGGGGGGKSIQAQGTACVEPLGWEEI